jgi:hypothetical protein
MPARLWTRPITAIPPALSKVLADDDYGDEQSRPSVSTIPKAFRPAIFLPASYPLAELVTVAARRTLRASMPGRGVGARPSSSRTWWARRVAMRSWPRRWTGSGDSGGYELEESSGLLSRSV